MAAISVRRDSYASVAGGADAAIPGWRDIYKPFSALMDSHRSLGLSTIGRIIIFRDALQESHICCSSLTGFVRERMPEGSSPRNAAYIVSGMIRGRYLIHDNDLHSVRASSELHDLIRDISSLLDGFCAIGDSRERMLRVDAGRKRTEHFEGRRVEMVALVRQIGNPTVSFDRQRHRRLLFLSAIPDGRSSPITLAAVNAR